MRDLCPARSRVRVRPRNRALPWRRLTQNRQRRLPRARTWPASPRRRSRSSAAKQSCIYSWCVPLWFKLRLIANEACPIEMLKFDHKMFSKSVHVLRCHAHDLGARQTDIAQLPIAQSLQFTDGAASLASGGDAIEEAV